MMRMKTTSKNYGRYFEALFICSKAVSNKCNELSHNLKHGHGIHNRVLVCEDFENFDIQTKKDILTTYCIIFVLSDDIIDVINKTFDCNNPQQNNLHPFIKTYKYVEQVNSHAIACVIQKDKALRNDLIFPEYMGDFERLHRLELDMDPNAKMQTNSNLIAYNIRYYYSDEEKEKLSNLHSNQADKGKAMARLYCESTEGNFLIAQGIIILMIIATFWNACKHDYNPARIILSSMFMGAAYALTLIINGIEKAKHKRINHGDLNVSEKRLHVLLTAGKCIINFWVVFFISLLLTEMYGDILRICMVAYLICSATYYWANYKKCEKLKPILDNANTIYLDYAIELRRLEKELFKKQCQIIIVANAISIAILILIKIFL